MISPYVIRWLVGIFKLYSLNIKWEWDCCQILNNNLTYNTRVYVACIFRTIHNFQEWYTMYNINLNPYLRFLTELQIINIPVFWNYPKLIYIKSLTIFIPLLFVRLNIVVVWLIGLVDRVSLFYFKLNL